MTRRYKLVGTDDSQSTCSCCGREDLKRVVWLVPLDSDGNQDGTPEHFGTTCAGRMLGYANPTAASTKNRVDREARKAAEEHKADLIAQAFRNAVALEVVRGSNRFGCPTATVQVNGEPITVTGRGPWAAEGTDEETRIVARRAYAGKQISSVTRKG